jgi:hypothetical protein
VQLDASLGDNVYVEIGSVIVRVTVDTDDVSST